VATGGYEVVHWTKTRIVLPVRSGISANEHMHFKSMGDETCGYSCSCLYKQLAWSRITVVILNVAKWKNAASRVLSVVLSAI
jgi:hypothetical protein